MPRTAARPGTERYRDERRKGGGPRMHARGWHDEQQPRDLEPVAQSQGADAAPEPEVEGPGPAPGPTVEASGDRAGVGRQRKTSGTQGRRDPRKRTTPPGKGRKPRTRAAKGTGHGHRRAGED